MNPGAIVNITGWDEAVSESAIELKFVAEGIDCAACAMDMERLLMERPGILLAKVDYATGIVTVRHDPSIIGAGEVFRALRGLGYKARPVKTD